MMRCFKIMIYGCLLAGMFALLGCGGGVVDSSGSQAKTFRVVPAGAGSYTIQAANMGGVAGIQLELGYDAALGVPTVTQGDLVAGALLAANTTLLGTVKIALISVQPFSGSGTVARISFPVTSGSGGITSMKASIVDVTGSQLTVQTYL
jgi:hypothetical protein